MQAWRAAHPGYSTGRPRTRRALQEPLFSQLTDGVEGSGHRAEVPATPEAVALQVSINALEPALTGLIAHWFGVTLQDEMAATTPGPKAVLTGLVRVATPPYESS